MYQIHSTDDGIVIQILQPDVKTYIPCSTASPLYREYLAWLAEGNEPLPADEPPTE